MNYLCRWVRRLYVSQQAANINNDTLFGAFCWQFRPKKHWLFNLQVDLVNKIKAEVIFYTNKINKIGTVSGPDNGHWLSSSLKQTNSANALCHNIHISNETSTNQSVVNIIS